MLAGELLMVLKGRPQAPRMAYFSHTPLAQNPYFSHTPLAQNPYVSHPLLFRILTFLIPLSLRDHRLAPMGQLVLGR